MRAALVKLVVTEGTGLAVLGAGLGLLLAALGSRLLRSLMFGVEALDPVSFGAAFLIALGVALSACAVPSRRAAEVDPLTALRES